ncbi:MAG: CvpA family protein [Clostridiales bacterium]|nr:CvpA family protein [Clostridiales bacterium]
MNLLVLSCIALALLCSLIGYKRGLIKSAVSAIGLLGAIVLANVLNPYINTFIVQHTGIRQEVKSRIETGIGLTENDKTLSVYEEEDYLEHLQLPELVKNYIRSNDKKIAANETNESLHARDYVSYIINYMTDMVVRGITFGLTLIIIGLILIIALSLSEILSCIPILSGLDKAGGVVFGLAQALIIIWICMIVTTLFSAFKWALGCMNMIEESAILRYVYDKNIFLKLVVDILGDI